MIHTAADGTIPSLPGEISAACVRTMFGRTTLALVIIIMTSGVRLGPCSWPVLRTASSLNIHRRRANGTRCSDRATVRCTTYTRGGTAHRRRDSVDQRSARPSTRPRTGHPGGSVDRTGARNRSRPTRPDTTGTPCDMADSRSVSVSIHSQLSLQFA